MACKSLPGLKVIFSIDKDLKTIPGLHWKDLGKGPQVVEVSEADADYFHALQTLMGDVTDGYKGLPGCGPKKAEDMLRPHHGDLKALWQTVEAAYVKAGLTRDDMLIQARCARILRASDYDFDNRKPILWEPPTC